ncbi:MAG: magnesium transporter CorA family protein [Calditrichia bacterium]
MNFAVVFNLTDRTSHKIDDGGLDFSSLSPENFAWVDLNFSEDAEIRKLLAFLGLNEQECNQMLESGNRFDFIHQQQWIAEKMQVGEIINDRLKSNALLVAMNNRLIITAHENSSGYIKTIRQNYEQSFRSVGKTPGFIFFLLWDAIVDGFLPQIFYIDDKLEEIEDKYLEKDFSRSILDDIIRSKRMVRLLKQSLLPMQRSMRHLSGSKLEVISDAARPYLYGIFDHLDRLTESVDSLQERVHDTFSGYNSVLSHQLNNFMKVLAIIATIMMPLSLLAAIYGTNFRYMPELEWQYGYFVFLGVLFTLGAGMLLYFKVKKWL